MKIAALIFFITFLIPGCVATRTPTPLVCSNFRKGRYGFTKTEFRHVGGIHKVVTQRIDSVETIITTGFDADTTIFKISWTGDCLYERTFLKSTNRWKDSLFRLIQKEPPQYRITTFTDRYYIEQSVEEKRRRDTIWIE